MPLIDGVMMDSILENIQIAKDAVENETLILEHHQGQLTAAQDIITRYPDCDHPAITELVEIITDGITTPTVGIEHYGVTNPTLMISRTLATVNQSLTVSQEAWWDLFTSQTAKMESTVPDLLDELHQFSGRIDVDAVFDIDVPTEYRTLDDAMGALEYTISDLLGNYRNSVSQVAQTAAKNVNLYFQEYSNLDNAVKRINAARVPVPNTFSSERANTFTSKVMYGGMVLSLTIDGSLSEGDTHPVSETHKVKTTGREVLQSCKRLERLAMDFGPYFRDRDRAVKDIKKISNQRDNLLAMPFAYGAIGALLGFTPIGALGFAGISLLNSAVRRRIQLLFRDSKHRERFTELKAASDVIDGTVQVYARAVRVLVKSVKTTI